MYISIHIGLLHKLQFQTYNKIKAKLASMKKLNYVIKTNLYVVIII